MERVAEFAGDVGLTGGAMAGEGIISRLVSSSVRTVFSSAVDGSNERKATDGDDVDASWIWRTGSLRLRRVGWLAGDKGHCNARPRQS